MVTEFWNEQPQSFANYATGPLPKYTLGHFNYLFTDIVLLFFWRIRHGVTLAWNCNCCNLQPQSSANFTTWLSLRWNGNPFAVFPLKMFDKKKHWCLISQPLLYCQKYTVGKIPLSDLDIFIFLMWQESRCKIDIKLRLLHQTATIFCQFYNMSKTYTSM